MKTSYENFMNETKEIVNVKISPSSEISKLVTEQIFAENGTDNYYDVKDLIDEAYDKITQKLVFKNKSLAEVQAIVEPLRISNPDQCVSLNTPNGDFIGNTSWNDQMNMFWEYETYTNEGKSLQSQRREEAKRLGLIASWE